MGYRALIIGIEKYPSVTDGSIAAELPGTLAAALAFRDWLIAKWDKAGIPKGEQQILFCSNPRQQDGLDATQAAIMAAIDQLREDGQQATNEFYFFFSGHGFTFVSKGRSDILIASDYASMKISGNLCFSLDQAIEWLQVQLGTGRQYYFVDACRNRMDITKINPSGFSLPELPPAPGDASTYVIQSVEPGAVAAVDGAFSGSLLAGLQGAGKAKVWDENDPSRMLVRFDSLKSFLREKLTSQRIYQRTAGTGDDKDAVLSVIQPVTPTKCLVETAIAGPGDIICQGRLTGRHTRFPLAAATNELSLPPDVYDITLRPKVGTAIVVRNVSLFEDLEVDADKAGAPLIEIDAFGHDTNMSRWKFDHLQNDGGLGHVLESFEFDDDAKGKFVGAARNSIAALFPVTPNGVDFSESLGGPIRDPDLDLWLAIVGASKILGGPGDYSKLGPLPLAATFDIQPDDSAVYVIAGFDDSRSRIAASCTSTVTPEWKLPFEPAPLAGIAEFVFRTKTGSKFVSLRIDDERPYTLVSATLPNRVTLITVTLDDYGELRISQYLLPLKRLFHSLDRVVAERLENRNQLNDIRNLALLTRAFRDRRDLAKSVKDVQLNEILYAKWLDPLSSALAAYELLRRGRSDGLQVVIENMNQFFPDLPDTRTLTALVEGTIAIIDGLPLIRDGLRALPAEGRQDILPASKLDYRSPWTAWRGVIE